MATLKYQYFLQTYKMDYKMTTEVFVFVSIALYTNPGLVRPDRYYQPQIIAFLQNYVCCYVASN